MSAIEIRNLSVSIHRKPVLGGIDLTIEKGDFMTFLGPSGCGKTTLLRTIAGLQRADGGTIRIGDKEVARGETDHHMEAAKRGVSLVFQSYALWPHMTVFDNVAFGLQVRRLPKANIQASVKAALEKMRIPELADRYPSQLSGGQQQRVAIARAIVTEPEILLLDEPLSNLDAKLRMEMRAELKRLHQELNTTIVYVTHDQHEAMTLSSRVAVFFGGRIVQVDAPRRLYRSPRTLQVAEFIGNAGIQMNFIEGTTAGEQNPQISQTPQGPQGRQWLQTPLADIPLGGHRIAAGQTLIATIKPEDVRLHDEPTPDGVAATVEAVYPSGSETLLQLNAQGERLMARVIGDADYEEGSAVYASLRLERVNLYDKQSGRLLEHTHPASTTRIGGFAS